MKIQKYGLVKKIETTYIFHFKINQHAMYCTFYWYTYFIVIHKGNSRSNFKQYIFKKYL